MKKSILKAPTHKYHFHSDENPSNKHVKFTYAYDQIFGQQEINFGQSRLSSKDGKSVKKQRSKNGFSSELQEKAE